MKRVARAFVILTAFPAFMFAGGLQSQAWSADSQKTVNVAPDLGTPSRDLKAERKAMEDAALKRWEDANKVYQQAQQDEAEAQLISDTYEAYKKALHEASAYYNDVEKKAEEAYAASGKSDPDLLEALNEAKRIRRQKYREAERLKQKELDLLEKAGIIKDGVLQRVSGVPQMLEDAKARKEQAKKDRAAAQKELEEMGATHPIAAANADKVPRLDSGERRPPIPALQKDPEALSKLSLDKAMKNKLMKNKLMDQEALKIQGKNNQLADPAVSVGTPRINVMKPALNDPSAKVNVVNPNINAGTGRVNVENPGVMSPSMVNQPSSTRTVNPNFNARPDNMNFVKPSGNVGAVKIDNNVMKSNVGADKVPMVNPTPKVGTGTMSPGAVPSNVRAVTPQIR